ncbi:MULTISPECIES: dTMP kinase [Enterococcaceae]|uniref:dTMP kinase n=1 Tax=Enterococcaceae TaxID=81852 RepID=UPI000E52DE1A|nr:MULTISPECIES: dTMP kinase [Enterococcaceae]MCI0130073.1 dTMP kinase [Vagococcus sp. CY53-2]RGI30932.1 dTMP kinase [Melissococcus sp. OM08-11BH]UNM88894.1 dTMP kinase [Vagococcus sp. CY52-2]
MSRNGVFITIEGPDGAGKSTVIEELIKKMSHELNVDIVTTREPGGIPISEKIREVILNPTHTMMDERTEALLYAAARRQHLVEKILPALETNHLVVCDRFIDSSIAYQGAARGIGVEEVRQINDFAIEGNYPDLTLYLDVEASVGLSRINKGRSEAELDRLDKESLDFHEQVRLAYLTLLELEPNRIKKIDASQSIENVVDTCYNLIKETFSSMFIKSSKG